MSDLHRHILEVDRTNGREVEVPSVCNALSELDSSYFVTCENPFEAQRIETRALSEERVRRGERALNLPVLIGSIDNKERALGPGKDILFIAGGGEVVDADIWKGSTIFRTTALPGDPVVASAERLLTRQFGYQVRWLSTCRSAMGVDLQGTEVDVDRLCGEIFDAFPGGHVVSADSFETTRERLRSSARRQASFGWHVASTRPILDIVDQKEASFGPGKEIRLPLSDRLVMEGSVWKRRVCFRSDARQDHPGVTSLFPFLEGRFPNMRVSWQRVPKN